MTKQSESDRDILEKELSPSFQEPVKNPVFVIVSGLPGTGKTYFSRKLAGRLPSLILESDNLRKILFPDPTYSGSESSRLFNAIHLLLKDLLRRGISVILDATNLFEYFREQLYRIARVTGAKLIIVQVDAPPAIVRARMEFRRQENTRSDADWDIYMKMKNKSDRITRKHYHVDTSKDLSPALDIIVKAATHG